MQCQKLKTYMETGRVVFLPIKAIAPNPSQPRSVFGEEALEDLSRSIRSHGVLQPLSVRRMGTGYQLIAGERRLRAAALAGLTDVPCILMHMDDREAAIAALVENLQRRDLNFVEEARGISRLLQQYSFSQEQAAQMLGKSQSAVANKLRLLRHSPRVLDALLENALSERHARALLRLPEEQKLPAVAYIAKQGMNVARTEQYVDALLARDGQTRQVNVKAFLHHLSQTLTKIQLAGVPAVSERRETDKQIVFTITIPKGMEN